MPDALAAAITEAHAAAREVWTDFSVELAAFEAALRERLGPDATPEQVAGCCTRDVYLAIACLAGDATAIGHLERDYLVEVAVAARKLRATDDQEAETRAHLRQILFTAEPERRAALAGFTGRGDLRGYLRVVATRHLIRIINRGRKEQPIDSLLERLDVQRAPELSLLKARHGPDIAAAMRTALETLDERPRALLRYSLIDGWSVDQIGDLYGVHRATAARWVAAARDALGDRIRTEVAKRLAIDEAEVDSIIELVRSRIDVSLERVL